MNECAPALATSASLLAPSLAAAFLGLLAFVSYLLHLRQSDIRKQQRKELETHKAAVDKLLGEAVKAIAALDKRVDTLMAGRAFGGTLP